MPVYVGSLTKSFAKSGKRFVKSLTANLFLYSMVKKTLGREGGGGGGGWLKIKIGMEMKYLERRFHQK